MESLFHFLQQIFESSTVYKFFAMANVWDKKHGHFIMYLALPLFVFIGIGYLVLGNARNKTNDD